MPPEALKAFDFRVSGGGGGQGLFGSPASDDPALLFLHERTTPRGTKYLVAVRLYPGYDIGWTLNARYNYPFAAGDYLGGKSASFSYWGFGIGVSYTH